MVVFLEFLSKIGLVQKVMECMPIVHQSPNSIPPAQTCIAFLIAVASGARRFAQTSWLRGDRALHGLLGIKRFPSDDTIRNLFLRFGMAAVQQFFEPITEWMMERLPARAGGHSLDLDSTVFEGHGEQQAGGAKGYNPRRPDRLSHHPLLAVLAESHFVMHGWLRSGNTGTGRGVAEFLKEALALWGKRGPLASSARRCWVLRSGTGKRQKEGLLIHADVLFEGVRGKDESVAISKAIGDWVKVDDPRFFKALDQANRIRTAILEAEVVAYEIDADADDDSVIEIFARLNQQGVRLKPGDLAAARLTGKMKGFRTMAKTLLTREDLSRRSRNQTGVVMMRGWALS
jgi:hypothetical protein